MATLIANNAWRIQLLQGQVSQICFSDIRVTCVNKNMTSTFYPANISSKHRGTKMVFSVMNIICSVLLSFFFLFFFYFCFQFCDNNYNNLVWLIWENKWECGLHRWRGCMEFWFKEKKIPLFLSFFFPPQQPGNLTWPITVWGGLSTL